MSDIRQSHPYAEYMRSSGWIVETVPVRDSKLSASSSTSVNRPVILAFIRKLGFLPLATMKIQRFSRTPDFKAIDRLICQYHVVSTNLEPGKISGMSEFDVVNLMSQWGYRIGRWPMLPTKTITIDLSKRRGELLSDMKKDARRSITKAYRQCTISIIDSRDWNSIDQFYRFWKAYGRGYIVKLSEFRMLLKAFGQNAYVVSCSLRNEPLLAGAVILVAGSRAYYYFAVTSPAGRRMLGGYLVVWEAMLEAKRQGCTTFDLEGIYDERYKQLKRWRGFSSFKHKFGGREILFDGVFVRTALR